MQAYRLLGANNVFILYKYVCASERNKKPVACTCTCMHSQTSDVETLVAMLFSHHNHIILANK